MDETLPEESRLHLPVWKTFRCYAVVVRNGRFLAMNLLQAFSSAALMAYISASPFLFQTHFGLTPMEYSLCFAGNAVGLVLGSAIVMRLSNLQKAAGWGALGLLATAVLSSLALLGGLPFGLFEVTLVPMLFCVGMITPVGITLALCSVAENRGMTSALLGAFPFLLGGAVAPLTGIGDMLRSTALIIVPCSLVCAALWMISRRWDYTKKKRS